MATIEAVNMDGVILKKIRDTAHIKSYLEHFVPPNISLSTIATSFFMTPFSMVLNIYFIIYNLIILHFNSNNDNNLKYISIGRQIIVYVEFIGICVLFAMIIVSYLLNYKSLFIDCIKNCSSWSSFRLFYYFRPMSLIEYYSVCYSHHQTRLKQTNMDKYIKCKQLKQRLEQEIINVNDNEQKQKINDTLDQLNAVIDELAQINQNKQQNDQYEETTIQYMIRIASWISFIFISICLLLLGMISLIMKLVQFKYLSDKDIFEWQYNQYFAFIAFCNQLWNMCNIDHIKKDAIYKFIFMKQNTKYTRFIANKISIYDAIIKQQLWDSFGIKGLFLAISLNSTFLHKLIVQNIYDNYNVDQLLIYKTISDKQRQQMDDKKYEIRNEQKVDSKSEPLLKVTDSKWFDSVAAENEPKSEKKSVFRINFSTAKLKIKHFSNNILNKLKMTGKQQPIPVFLVAQSLLERYRQKSDDQRCNNILYGKRHEIEIDEKKISYNEYSFNTEETDFSLTIKPNFFKNIIVLFEKMEVFIRYFTPTTWLLVYLATFIAAILALINSNQNNNLMDATCNGYDYLNYPLHFIISCGIFLAFGTFLVMPCLILTFVDRYKPMECQYVVIMVLSTLGCFTGIVYSIVVSCIVLSCVNMPHNEWIMESMKQGWKYYYIFVICLSVWIYSLLTIPILLIISYPITFILFCCIAVVIICGQLIAPIISFAVPILTLDVTRWVFDHGFVDKYKPFFILTVFQWIFIIWYYLLSFGHGIHRIIHCKRFCQTGLYQESSRWSIVHFVTQILIYICYVIDLIFYYYWIIHRKDNVYSENQIDLKILMVMSWIWIGCYFVLYVFIAIKGKHIFEEVYFINCMVALCSPKFKRRRRRRKVARLQIQDGDA